jgi:rsbT co-antagonist protein RsbR
MTLHADADTVRQRIALRLAGNQGQIQRDWIAALHADGQTIRIDRVMLEDICDQLLARLTEGLHAEQGSASRDLSEPMRDLLSGISADLAERGLAPAQTAAFIFSLRPRLEAAFAEDPEAQRAIQRLIDAMGIHSMDAFIARREQIIRRQTQELLDISVPVVPLWEGILSLPIIGTLDSGRAQAITEKLLLEIARTNSRHALLDISGVPTVDTQTAQYLARTVAAARLMGAECVITGIRPAIAQVMVALGINLSTVETRFSLAEGLRYCFARLGVSVQQPRD